MANHTLYATPVFDENLRKYETEDEVHADVFNAVDEKLINNDYYLKKHLDDVTKNSKEHRENNEIHITKKQKEEWSGKAENAEVTREKKGLMSPADKTKLDGIATNAEVNQNAFSYVKIGNTTVAANGKTAAVEFAAGTNIQLTADNATKKITISGTEHKHEDADIKSLDASKLTGVIDIERLPKGALERCIVVANDTARFALTKEQVQAGDTVKVNATNKMYFVVNDAKLNTEAGYEVYAAGNASTVLWAGIIEKPSEFQPSKHTHIKEEISNFPSSMPANGGNADTVDGFHSGDFIQHRTITQVSEVEDSHYPQSYEGMIFDEIAYYINLPSNCAWYIKYFKPTSVGKSMQIAFPLGGDNTIMYRWRETETAWCPWIGLATKNQLDDCFQLVSDGKTLVANAITDKGVSTAANAEFATMANNIRNIQTGVNTSDATMTASDLLSGKTGYVNGKKITGSMTNRGEVSATLNGGDVYRIPAGYHNGQGEIRARSLIKNTQTQSFIHMNPMIQEGLYFSISKDGFIKVNISAKVTNGGNVTREVVFYNGKELESKGHFIPASFSNSQLAISFGTAYDEGEAMVTIYDLSSIL